MTPAFKKKLEKAISLLNEAEVIFIEGRDGVEECCDNASDKFRNSDDGRKALALFDTLEAAVFTTNELIDRLDDVIGARP